jgi:hypothetical protein
VYSENPHIMDELKHSIYEALISIKVSAHKLMSVKRLEVCLRAEGKYFENLCW